MKITVITIALAVVAATAPLNAQVLSTSSTYDPYGTTPPNEAAWIIVGTDKLNDRIYERRTRDRNGNVVVQRGKRTQHGGMYVTSTRRIPNRRSCDYLRSGNTIGDVLLVRENDESCNDQYVRENDGWYQLGHGPDDNSIYERQTRDGNGKLIIERARRNGDGSLTILSTRRPNSKDTQWKRARGG